MKVVLHICCGVCAAGAAERLLAEGHEVLGYFFNPNIYPADEYQRRLGVARRVATELGFPLGAVAYEPETWFAAIAGLEEEPEGGQRCEVCFRMRLEQTHRCMQETHADAFTTTLTIGPRKQAAVINRIGAELAGECFLERDFKKGAGFQRAIQLAKRWDLYRQDYCGCLYSLRERRRT